MRLNPTAAEVLELCDGERSLDEIVGALSARYDGADVRDDVRELVDAMARARARGRCRRLGPPRSIAELTYQCPLHCPYCSNPLDIGGERYRDELETEHWIRVFGEARRARRPPARAHRRRADAAPRSRRARAPARATPACTRSSSPPGTLFTRERAAGAQGGRARPRADLDPEPGPRGQRPHRRQPVVREEDRGRAPRARSSASR